MAESLGLRAYHGTCWSAPLLPDETALREAGFVVPDIDRSRLGAAFFSNDASVGAAFASLCCCDPDTQVQALLVVEIAAERVLSAHFSPQRQHFEFAGKQFQIPHEREALHSALREKGYQAFVMTDDYCIDGRSADDIAILDPDCIRPQGVQLLLDEQWTPVLSGHEARQRFAQWWHEQLYDTSMTPANTSADFALS